MTTPDIKRQVLAAAAAAEDKKAEDIRILALDPSESSLTDYFLICNGTNDRQNVAISDSIDDRMKRDFGMYPNSVEGRRQGEWILMDYVDFVVHIFSPEKRAHYGLERLRKSARTITLAELDAELNNRVKAARISTPAPAPAAVVATPAAAPITAPAKKSAAPRKKAAVKNVVAKKKPAAPKKAAKKPVVKKAAKKTVARKLVKAAAPKKAAKKATKPIAKKKAVRKSVKPAVKKTAMKVVAKKSAKPTAKKASPKKSAKKKK